MPKPDPKLSIKSPCPKKWNELVGDDSKRFCSQCQKHVHNGEALTQVEAADLVREGQGNTCMRLVADDSGSIVYKDSPKRTKPNSIVRRAGLAIAAGGLVAACSSQPEQAPSPDAKPLAASEQQGMPIAGAGEEAPIEVLEATLGEVCEVVMGDVELEESHPAMNILQEELKSYQMLGRVIMTEIPAKPSAQSEPHAAPQTDSASNPPREILGTPLPTPTPPPED